MLNAHYSTFEHICRQDVETTLRRSDLSGEQRRHYLCHVIEARAYHIFKQEPSQLCGEIAQQDLAHYFRLLAKEQNLQELGCLCPDQTAATLRQGPFPPLQEAIADWPVATIVQQIREELEYASLRGGASTREPIYTGDWWSINLFDSSLDTPCPASRLFPKSLNLILNTKAMQRSLQLVNSTDTEGPSLIARLSCIGPHSRIEPHFGVNLWKTRIHLPIQIPPQHCFIVGYTEQRQWQKDQALILDDTYLHAVVNDSEQARIVLLVDIIHPKINQELWDALMR